MEKLYITRSRRFTFDRRRVGTLFSPLVCQPRNGLMPQAWRLDDAVDAPQTASRVSNDEEYPLGLTLLHWMTLVALVALVALVGDKAVEMWEDESHKVGG
jgi:hypothetical protein